MTPPRRRPTVRRPTVRRLSAVRPAVLHPAVAEALEHRQLLSAALSVSSGLMVYNAVKGSNSPTETLTLTDTGDAALTLGPSALAVSGGNAAQWTLNDAASAPATLAPGASFALTLTYKPTIVGRQMATLTVTTNDPVHPTQTIALSGIGAAGLGGSNQPSLARILRAYGIPTIVGEGLNDSAEASDSTYPNPPDGSSQEVSLQQLVKAGSGPVTINVLASFTAAGAEPYTLGYYTPGTPTDRHELFYTPASEYQSTYVQPQGSTSFDPGGKAFGLYFVSNVQVAGRIGYSEDQLNTWDATNDRKFRFFPMENPDGSAVPHAYVMTTTEWNAPVGYDFTNVVAVISNVTAAPNLPTSSTLSVTDPYALPGSSNVEFTNIRFPNPTIGDVQHNADTLTLTDSGEAAMSISSLSLSNTAAWSITAGPSLPIVLAPGGSTTVTLKYNDRSTPNSTYDQTADPTNPGGGGFETGTLSIGSSDLNAPVKVVKLAGYTQYHSEDSNEPSLQSIVNLLEGYGTLINGSAVSTLPESTSTSGSSPTYYGEETVSAYWSQADPARPVTVDQVAAYHTEGDADTFGWYKQGSTSVSTILNQASDDGQTIFPLNSSGQWATGSFTTTSTFGFRLSGTAGTEWSDDARNTYYPSGGGHHMRFFPVRDYQGTLIPNTYLCTMDYATPSQNFDFQDNVYLVTNVRPAAATAVAPSAPTDEQAYDVPGVGVQVTWAPSTAGGAAGYNVYRQNPDFTFTKVTPTPIAATAYLDTAGDTTRVNNYRVTAVSADGTQESVASGAITTLAGPPAPSGYGGISGRVFDDSNGNGHADAGEVGQAHQLVFLDLAGTGTYDPYRDPAAVTDALGNYVFAGLYPGTYTVGNQPAPGYNRTLPGSSQYTVTVAANGTAARVDFGSDGVGYVYGTVFLDINGNGTLDGNEPGLANYPVYIDNNRNGQYDPGVDTMFNTDAGGGYVTTGLPPGTYELGQDVRAGWGRSSPAGSTIVTVTEGGYTHLNWAETRGTLFGTVFTDYNANGSPDAGDTGIAGINLFIDYYGTGVYQSGDLQVTTGANGMFSFVGMAPGTYTFVVQPPPSGYRLTTAASYTLTFAAGQIVTGYNFGFAPTVAQSSAVASPAASTAAAAAA